MTRLAVFASGSGSNAENLARYFREHPSICLDWILSNNPAAGVLDRASNLGISSRVFSRPEFYQTPIVADFLEKENIDLIILAGFLWLVPDHLMKAYPNRIINIHPALLPAYGGKGMYGMHVHEAVIAAGESESGITIHLINEHYDEGRILFQARCPIGKKETATMLAEKIHALEHQHFPVEIERYIQLMTQPPKG